MTIHFTLHDTLDIQHDPGASSVMPEPKDISYWQIKTNKGLPRLNGYATTWILRTPGRGNCMTGLLQGPVFCMRERTLIVAFRNNGHLPFSQRQRNGLLHTTDHEAPPYEGLVQPAGEWARQMAPPSRECV